MASAVCGTCSKRAQFGCGVCMTHLLCASADCHAKHATMCGPKRKTEEDLQESAKRTKDPEFKFVMESRPPPDPRYIGAPGGDPMYDSRMYGSYIYSVYAFPAYKKSVEAVTAVLARNDFALKILGGMFSRGTVRSVWLQLLGYPTGEDLDRYNMGNIQISRTSDDAVFSRVNNVGKLCTYNQVTAAFHTERTTVVEIFWRMDPTIKFNGKIRKALRRVIDNPKNNISHVVVVFKNGRGVLNNRDISSSMSETYVSYWFVPYAANKDDKAGVGPTSLRMLVEVPFSRRGRISECAWDNPPPGSVSLGALSRTLANSQNIPERYYITPYYMAVDAFDDITRPDYGKNVPKKQSLHPTAEQDEEAVRRNELARLASNLKPDPETETDVDYETGVGGDVGWDSAVPVELSEGESEME